ncbi:hypothetical protein A2707_00140 [Candidatus Saccharibacteria bacterium RIFCSPHIGHO2_01_FULL_45_15]|nr:MAG: hypothetical protein A2707_00140 [Candidatus Saccharibacteria bacterium RIFCSPHIGHO2_01_FULL_45_15]OGL28529.1 MAG: hypothetical protein A3C39_03700 [Candidatus Saccharibacteria bacterium RIFCSPHIGHO2_02_FULL_46_12]OGL32383.1 MAG: hypothetical protein A3E76_04525 [Candidatus Saccharibacteria bacterium RIFCSPHIGHO2_12_FULL_44_22]
MKTAIVPAQVTTVEDKVAGNLNLTQLVLIASPVFLGGVLYALLPPSFEIATYKIVAMTTLFCVFALLAIRIKERLLLMWLVIFFRYNSRPRYYILDKNDLYLRDIATKSDEPIVIEAASLPEGAIQSLLPQLDTAERARFEAMLSNPNAKLSLMTNKKGMLYVSITEIK